MNIPFALTLPRQEDGDGGLPRHRSLVTAMDTVVSIEAASAAPEQEVLAALERAGRWFGTVERVCSRFDPASELRQLVAHVGEPMLASPVLFEAVQFAIALARRTGGAFDPTVGQQLEAMGFNRNYVTGETSHSEPPAGGRVSYRDVRLDPARRTVTLRRPLVLDLGAVAKGLAVDLAARELAPYERFCIDAGGDLYVRGRNRAGQPWRIGVQDPRDPAAVVCAIEASDEAVCTSGDYERRTADGLAHHLLDPRTGRAAAALRSVTVVAPTAMAADGLATAAFVLGADRGLRLLTKEGTEGFCITTTGEMRMTPGFERRIL